jgi:hypothetical protein
LYCSSKGIFVGAEIQTLVDGGPSFVEVWTHLLMDMLGVNNFNYVDIYKGAEYVVTWLMNHEGTKK